MGDEVVLDRESGIGLKRNIESTTIPIMTNMRATRMYTEAFNTRRPITRFDERAIQSPAEIAAIHSHR